MRLLWACFMWLQYVYWNGKIPHYQFRDTLKLYDSRIYACKWLEEEQIC